MLCRESNINSCENVVLVSSSIIRSFKEFCWSIKAKKRTTSPEYGGYEYFIDKSFVSDVPDLQAKDQHAKIQFCQGDGIYANNAPNSTSAYISLSTRFSTLRELEKRFSKC
ncbi:hypothetical protein AJ79_02148 [Helicocarpus griseus UAMH5409]|uniref:Uncharacterized protein n=1 Tax=Helicocarpus griseus UAMH5409 TaxID=1447875 RepID=A0A2B7Y4J4_9EURO|nr:hypothetical protein AJ79_02148 [Helicocarpus griseus UAMH5409]